LGTLTAMDFVNQGQITSQIRTESLDDAPSTLTGQVSGTLTLSGPGLTLGALASTLAGPRASAVQAFDAAAYDGRMDFTAPGGLRPRTGLTRAERPRLRLAHRCRRADGHADGGARPGRVRRQRDGVPD